MIGAAIKGFGSLAGRRIATGIVVGGGIDFASRRMMSGETGSSVGGDLLASGLTGLAYGLAPGIMLAKDAFDIAAGVGEAYKSGKSALKYNEARYDHNFGGYGRPIVDTDHAYTQRQRALSIAQQTKQRATYGMGNEARAMSRMQTRMRG